MIPSTMAAVLLTGHGGLDRLHYRADVPVPRPGSGEVLIRVAAAGVNNTDINTRTGWYSKALAADSAADGGAGYGTVSELDATWSGRALVFPRIQGADVCGRVVEVGEGVAAERVGERVVVRTMLRAPVDHRPFECWTLGSECDGGFAQFTVAPAPDTYRVRSGYSDAELAAIPCAYSTAENMLHRAGVTSENVLITGASGGVGLAAVQLGVRRGATVSAVCSASKASAVAAQGAARTLDRDADPLEALGRGSMDVVVDLVGGPRFGRLLEVLRPGGRYVTSGAIGSPLAEIDLRTLYLRDLTLLGATFQPDDVFDDLVGYVERGEVRPVVARTYPLAEIVRAQQDFLTKAHAGKLVLIPPEIAP